MKTHINIKQGSPEWHALRAGKATASSFHKILTPTGKASTQAKVYMESLLAEIMIGESVSTWEGNKWTDRGTELEPDAICLYEMITEQSTQEVGFVEDYGVGCSPDRFIGDDGLLETKCPAAHTHAKYLLENKMPSEYTTQVQGQLYVTGRKWCDFTSYHPEMPPLIIRVKRDEDYITKLSGALNNFNINMAEKIRRLVELGHLKQE